LSDREKRTSFIVRLTARVTLLDGAATLALIILMRTTAAKRERGSSVYLMDGSAN
jgi:hypothetical protein